MVCKEHPIVSSPLKMDEREYETVRWRARVSDDTPAMNCLQTPPFFPLHLRLYRRDARPPSTSPFFSLPCLQKSVSFVVRSSELDPPPAVTGPEILRRSSSSDPGGSAVRESAPAVRCYECDLSRLTLVGPVDFEQAITAAAVDGGVVADEHLSSGVPEMVVETVFPGSPDDHITIATRLFLPARKVKEKARKLKQSLNADIMAHATSGDILAMTFRQVVLYNIWSFELVIFSPGNERNMDELESPRQVLPAFSMSSSNKRVLSMLAEAVCSCVLKWTVDLFYNVKSKTSRPSLSWFQKDKPVFSSDSSISICRICEDEVIENAKKLVEEFKFVKKNYRFADRKMKDQWCAPPVIPRLEEIGGPGFQTWVYEFVPAYRIQINVDKFEGVEYQGWHKTVDDRWELLLTHFQMVDLANVLDQYYEDPYTIPDKHLSFGLAADLPKLSKSKKSSFWQVLLVTLATGCILLSIGVVTQLCQPRLFKVKKPRATHLDALHTEVDCCQEQSLEASEVEELCRMVIEKIKEALHWPGDIMFQPNVGTWTGELPSYLKEETDISFTEVTKNTTTSTLVPHQTSRSSSETLSHDRTDSDIQALTPPDAAIYQVILSGEGDIVGFMPMSRAAVNHWARNPLARMLYKGKNLSPGFLEPGLRIELPGKVIPLELLISINPASEFALVRCGMSTERI